MNERVRELLSDVRRWFTQALTGWGESIKDDPIQHVFSLGAGVALAIGIFAVL